MKRNYTYMVKCSDGTLYTGWTTDLEHRVKAHNDGEGTLSAETDSDDIVFTNSYKAPKDGKTTDTPKKPDKARRGVATGDNSHMVLYLVLMIAAAAAVSMVIIRRKRR